jgi:uncharacterized protein (DUF885 family)
MLDRRTLIAAAAGAALPSFAHAQTSRDAALREVLDRIEAALKGDPGATARGLGELERFGAAGLSRPRRFEYEAVRQGLRRELQPQSYAQKLQLAFGGPVDPLAAHEQAARACRTLQQRADLLLRSQGLTRGSVAERLRDLARDPRWLYPDDGGGRDRAVADMNASLAWVRPRMAAAFGALPVPPARNSRMSPADEAAGRAGYRDAPAGLYYVDLKNIRGRPAWTLPGVAFHETVPGHLLQAALQEAAAPHPLRLRYSPAFSEAWATYAEQLAADLGAYASDPRGELGYLQWRLFRLGRIVVDTGLHAKGWTPAQAISTLTEIQGQSIAFVTIETDVERMSKNPGIEAARGLGAMVLSRLRPRRRSAWPAYHRAVLADGPWPFGILEQVVRG